MPNQNRTDQNLRVTQIVWAGLLLSQLIYIFIAFKLYGPLVFFNLDEVDTAAQIYFAAAFLSIGIGFLIFNLLTKPIKRAASFEEAQQKFFIPFILRLVLIETCSVIGFLYSSVVEKNMILNFSVFALLAFAFCFPSAGRIKKLMR